MRIETVDTLVVGGGQAGLAMSEHLGAAGVEHLVLERARIAERWRTARWDGLVANGPAWHDRFPSLSFADVGVGDDEFATKDEVVRYFETFARRIEAPIRCGVNVTRVSVDDAGEGFLVETSEGAYRARNVVAATGPFQTPLIPPLVPALDGVAQIHSAEYHRPEQLAEGAVLVVGAGSSGSQIAEELLLAGRTVHLSVGPHERPPRRYRDRDFVWWLGALGKWQMKTPPAGREHVTIAVSGARGGHTVEFRRFAERGMRLLGTTTGFREGHLHFAADLAANVAAGDASLLALLDEADAHVERLGLDLPPEPDARRLPPDPPCLADPIRSLDLAEARITTIVWATGYAQDFGWLEVDVLDERGGARHERGIAAVPGIYFVGLPWLSMRGSSFIWGVWEDARYLADHIARRGAAPIRTAFRG